MSEPTDNLSESMLSVLANMPGGVMVFSMNPERKLLYINESFLNLYGADSRECLEAPDLSAARIFEKDRKLVLQTIADLPSFEGKHNELSCRIIMMNGNIRMIRARLYLVTDEKAGEACIFEAEDFGMVNPCSPNPYQDDVTGLLTMWGLFRMLDTYRYENTQDQNRCLLYCNITNFQLVNEKHGHAGGDAFLRQAGAILREQFPRFAMARLDSDHFCLIAEDEKLAERTAQAGRQIQKICPDVRVSLVAGARKLDSPAVLPEAALDDAKSACDYGARAAGAVFAYYSAPLGKRLRTREYVVSHIDEAIRMGWIETYYQPIVRTISGQAAGFEALARWNDPERGMLSPADFIEALEDARLITKLDLCMIRNVCRHHRERKDQGLSMMPCSVNLSRIDFVNCDILSEVNDILRTYEIPRSMIRIEVTESVLSGDAGHIRDTLFSFKKEGYEIWMDDFGSAYSNLNVLKDYPFDVLKIDMVFLRNENERARNIISSIISMDRMLGMRTLAEGVETKEQAQFLRQNGCDMAQGYYFGRPMPENRALEFCLQHGIALEEEKWKPYYDAVSKINFRTDVPMVLCEYDGKNYHILFMNEPYLELSAKTGIDSVEKAERYLNCTSSAANREFRKSTEYAIRTGKPGVYFYESRGMELRLRFFVVSSFGGRYLFEAHLENVTKQDRHTPLREKILQNLRYFYDELFVINLKEKTVQPLMETGTEDGTCVSYADSEDLLHAVLPSVFSADEDRYRVFADPETMLSRIQQSGGAILHGCFRTENAEGNYVWKAHRILVIPHTDETLLLYGVRTIDPVFFEDELADIRRDPYQAIFQDRRSEKEALFDDLMDSSPIPFFWKDRERRFVGASRSFLDYYGMDTIAPILGKTDEEIGWHPQEGPYRSDEEEVLQEKKLHLLVPGRCIAKGVTHQIYATKWPVYRDGSVAGLMGFFLDGDTAALAGKKAGQNIFHDEETGIANLSGILSDYVDYREDLRLHGRHFAVILITVPGIMQQTDSCDEKQGAAVRKACADAIVRAVGSSGSTARAGVTHFVVLFKYENPQEAASMAERIRNEVDSIQEVGGRRVTPYCRTRVLYADLASGFEEEVLRALHDEQKPGTAEDLSSPESIRTLHNFFEEMPIGVAMLRMDGKIMYWNGTAAELTGYGRDEIEGLGCGDTPLQAFSEDGKLLCGRKCPLWRVVKYEKPMVKRAFYVCRDGSKKLLRSTFMPLRDAASKIRYIVWYFDEENVRGMTGELAQNLVDAANRDPVTGLPGRTYLEQFLANRMEEYRRNGALFAVLFADVDHFHDFNNIYGHDAGDRILQAFGRALAVNGRRTDCWGRWGGDEFVAVFLIRNPSDIEGAAERFWSVAESIGVPYGDLVLKFHIAIGITAVRQEDTEKTVIQRADRYMFLAKRNGGERQIVTDFNAGDALKTKDGSAGDSDRV